MSSSPAATYELDGHVATITYNRPDKLNAVNGAMRQALNAAWDQFMADEDAWVGIVTGAGRAFCAGADMVDGAGSVGTWPGSFWEIPTINSFESGLEVWKPTIAAVNGPCVGYGLTAASACDFLIASDRASFAFPEVKLGVATIVGSIRLPPKLGWANAMELLLTGDAIDADRAGEMGLAWKVVPHDDLLDEAHTLAGRLCQGAPLALRAVKEMAWRSQFLPWAEAIRMGETMRRVVGATDDARTGMAARARGETPEWQGR
ncbi:MAG: enoyl-CoA hydratase/isomerase family protein [Acidimicrobiales bacterium]